MLRRRLFSAAAVTSLGAAMLLPTPAGADSSTFPPTIDTIVHGDLTDYQWMLPAVNAAEAHAEATGAGVTVAVIDTGVDATHPDLEGQVVPGAYIQRNEITNKFELVPATTVEETSDDWFFHGTHVSGIIAGDDDGNGITGIAPDAKILPIHAAPRREYIRDVQFWTLVAQSIDYSVAQGADVINMSVGEQSSGIVPTDDSAKYLAAIGLLCDAVDNAKAAGTVVVASAGNEGLAGWNPENVPASCDGTFTVAAVGPSLDTTFWSSFDAAVDIAAPGEDVLSADSTVADLSSTPHVFASGTSMSSPVVAGVAALVIEQHPLWTPDQVQNKITATAEDRGVPGRDPKYGWGVVDAANAVGAVAPAPQPQNFFATWYESSWGGKNGESVVSWMTPANDAVTGYTVDVYTDTTTSTYDVDGQTVRADVLLPPGAWYVVTAHTTSGDVVSYPGSRYSRDGGDRPARLRDASMKRGGDTMTIQWARPKQKEDVDVIRAYVSLDGMGVSKKIKIDQSQPFPTSMKVALPTRARWSDAYGYLVLYNKDDNGRTIGVNGMSIKKPSPAVYGSHVKSIDKAGARAVEVTGAVSRLNAQRVCGKSGCSGESAVLVIDRGKRNERIDVLFTSRGVFHAMVDVDRGTDALRLRIEGPKSLGSGPFAKLKVGGGVGGDGCRGC